MGTDIIDQEFAEIAAEIRAQRVGDAELDEICRDFELLTKDLRKLRQIEGKAASGRQSNIRDSLAGLKQEILARASPGR